MTSSVNNSKIEVREIVHRGAKRVGLFFDVSNPLIQKVRRLPGRRFSKTKACWYINYRADYAEYLTNFFNGQICLPKGKTNDNGEYVNKKLLIARSALSDEVKKSINEFHIYLRTQRYSKNTIDTYTSMVINFFRYIRKLPQEINNDDIKRYNDEYIFKNGFSATTQNQFISAIKKYYEKIQNRNLTIEDIERPRKSNPLPKVISRSDIKELILSLGGNIKHKTIISLIYSVGLRRSEAINLKLIDIDSKRMTITIINAKGSKDRVVGLSKNMLKLLKKYYKFCKPKVYLFEGWGDKKYSATSVQKIFKQAKERVGIKKQGGVHMLRHSCATHMHEAGVDIRVIQEILGHKSSKTTEIYTHVSTKTIRKVKSPFDDMDI